MVKPALAYLDVLKEASLTFGPAPGGLQRERRIRHGEGGRPPTDGIDERKIVTENLTAMKRAGAKVIITYHALDMAAWLREKRKK